MPDAVDQFKDLNLERCAPQLDRSELADIWFQSGFPEGFSMEWVFDRYEQAPLRDGRWA